MRTPRRVPAREDAADFIGLRADRLPPEKSADDASMAIGAGQWHSVPVDRAANDRNGRRTRMMCRWRTAWAAGGVGVAATFLGCNFIVGVGDYEVGGDGGLADDAMGSESDGTSNDVLQPDVRSVDAVIPDAHPASDSSDGAAHYVDASYADQGYGDAPLVPDSANGDAAYVDVRADQASDAGADREPVVDAESTDSAAADSAPVSCGSTLPGADDAAFQQLVKACTLAVSCDPQFFDENISNCITNDLFASSTFYQCLPAISTCSDFFACWGVGYPSTSDSNNADNNGGAICNQQYAINGETSGLGQYEYNCTVLGGTCQVFTDPDGYQTARCVVGNGKCSDADYTVSCTGTSNYECIGGVPYGKDCAKFGGTCVSGTAGTGCLPPGSPCTSASDASAFVSTCSGTTLVSCDTAWGVSYPWDCSVAHEQCAASANLCVSPGCSSTAVFTERCDTSSGEITVSVGGAPYVINCNTIDVFDGFNSCSTDTDSSGNVYAYCTLPTQ